VSRAEDAVALLAEAEREQELAQSELVERLAVLGTFAPGLLEGAQSEDVLRLLCDSLATEDAMLVERRRIDTLVRMLQRGGREELARVRATAAPLVVDGPLQRMLDAFVLGGGPPLEDRDEDELLASLEVWRWATEAVARAGLTREIGVWPDKDQIESRLALLDVTRAVRRLAEGGCVGRETELASLHEFRRTPVPFAGLLDDPAMVLYGLGGVGKSTLVARFVMDLVEQVPASDPGVWAYLDLDRPTLASCRPDVVLADISRQIAAQLIGERRGLARGEEILRRRRKGAGLESADDASSHRAQAIELARTVHEGADGALLVVLDTYEQLESNHPEQAGPLYETFAVLAADLPRFRLVVSGRAPAEQFADRARPDRRMHVEALQPDAALELLRHFADREAQASGRPIVKLDDALGREVIALVGGIPLTVRLAASVLAQDGQAGIEDAVQRARTLDRVRTEFVRGFLYQRILSHVTATPPVTTEELRRLARAAIALRHVGVAHVERILAPELGHPQASPADLFSALASEVAFVERQDDGLRLREELRAPALMALRLDDPGLVQRVHQRAVEFYAALPGDPDAALELAYHRLALGASPAEFDAATLLRLGPIADELPPASAAQMRDAVGDPVHVEQAQRREAAERDVLARADAALRAGRLTEARRMLDEQPERSPGTELHRIESRLAEAEGDLGGAVAAAQADLGASRNAGDPTRFAAAALRLAGLHEALRHGELADAALLDGGEAELLAGHLDLRLELLLNRINLRERTGLETEGTRWSMGLQARALLQRGGLREGTGHTAVTRLLAAALGREEPERIYEAVRRVGLGHDEDPVRVQALVRALADWDAAQPEPGSLARRADLRLEGADHEAILRAWNVLTGLGTDAGLLLDRVLRQGSPPPDVRETLRQIYLWWAVAPTVPVAPAAAAPPRGGPLPSSVARQGRSRLPDSRVLHWLMSPVRYPCINHAWRCALDPCVQPSGFTWPVAAS
jgi:hypothetical protein